MATYNNLTDLLTSVADSIRAKKGTEDKINPQNFAEEIANIQSGGSGGAGSVFKITNKLNGYAFGGPSFRPGTGVVLHTYQFEGGTLAAVNILPIFAEGIEEGWGNGFPSQSGSPGPVFNASTPLGYALDVQSVPGYSIRYGSMFVSITNGIITCGSTSSSSYNSKYPLQFIFIASDINGNYDIDTFSIQTCAPCLVRDTKISLFDGTTKLVQDVNYNDELLVWNFDDGKYDVAKPLWIKKEQKIEYYYEVVLENGTIFKCTGPNGHRMFNVDKQMFLYPSECVGDNVYTLDGIFKVVSCERKQSLVDFYNIITKFHMNLFADTVLTSCRYNNLYPIVDMVFVKDGRLDREPKWKLYEQFRDHQVLGKYIEDLRLYEQLDIPIEETISYCERLESLRKNLDDFEDNKSVVKSLEDTEVGWIDRAGNAYGFKLYMPGHFNHIILAEKICQELGINTDNPSRYLEKEGWMKYSTDFVINSDDKLINENQLSSLKKFLNIPNKLKVPGKIRIGSIIHPLVDVVDLNAMDKYSFEYHKQRKNIAWD